MSVGTIIIAIFRASMVSLRPALAPLLRGTAHFCLRPFLFTVMLAPLIAHAQLPAAERTLFNYDTDKPLNFTGKIVEKRASVQISEIEFDSPRGGRVTGFLVEPHRHARHAGILFGHWGPGNSTEFLPEAIRYAAAGAVCLLIDYPWTRPHPYRRNLFTPETTPEQDRDTLAHAVVDLRRAIDLLVSHADVDRKRIAYIGHSFGAQFGAILTAVDGRLATSILIAGTPTDAAIYLESEQPDMVELRKNVGIDNMRKFVDVIGELDAINFIPHIAATPLLFQFARYEHYFNEEHMRAYFAAAAAPKEVRWYSSGHDPNDPAARLDRFTWLAKHIGLKARLAQPR